MALSIFVGLLMCAAMSSAAYNSLQWSDCGSDPAISVQQISVTPMPVVLPGPMHLTVRARMGVPLSDVQINLSLKRSTFLLDLPIPCLFNIGSCTYETSCTGTSVLDKMVSEDWAGIAAGLGTQIQAMLSDVPGLNSTQCPVPAMDINIQDYVINLPEIPSILSFFAEGDYAAQISAVDKPSGRTLLCLSLHLTLQEKEEPCTGIFCG